MEIPKKSKRWLLKLPILQFYSDETIFVETVGNSELKVLWKDNQLIWGGATIDNVKETKPSVASQSKETVLVKNKHGSIEKSNQLIAAKAVSCFWKLEV